MDIFFINQAERIDRGQRVEENFRAANTSGWRLHRVEPNVTAGPIDANEKSRSLAHAQAIAQAMLCAGHALIAEDNILFGAQTFAAIEEVLPRLPEDGWDIVFTDLAMVGASTLVDLFMLRRRLVAAGRLELIDPAKLPFFGATAYIVNRDSQQKMLDLLASAEPDMAHERCLAQWIDDGRLRARVIFPFVTSVSGPIGNAQAGGAEMLFTAFRRLVWQGRDAAAIVESLRQAPFAPKDAETIAFVKILATMLDPAFRSK